MVVEVVKNSTTVRTGKPWVARKTSTDDFGVKGIGRTTRHDTQKAAIKSARRIADKGERIVVLSPAGGVKRVVRQGR